MIQDQLHSIFSKLDFTNTKILPSQFAEENIVLSSDVSTVQGKFSYDITPYLREIVDTASPYHPAKVIAGMKGAQIGFTQGVIAAIITWAIANNPGNIISLSADDDLSKEFIESRLDPIIKSAGIQHLIRPNTIRKRNQRTGDTSKYKEFAGGRLFAGGLKSMNKLGKQRSLQYGFFDDWDAAEISDKIQGNVFELIEQRFSSSAQTMKLYFISTPQTKPSNIESVYLMGDQRKWYIPCPLCGEMIEIIWYKKKDEQSIGVVYKCSKGGNLIESSVGYVCQECGGFFKEKHKYEMNLCGEWRPTATPIRHGYYSYHIPALCAAPHMFGWTDYVHKWLRIYKDGQESKSKLKVFRNVVQGLPWENRSNKIKGGRLAMNTRSYDIGEVPNKLSNKDGNGDIILLTCACDINGTIDDARLDYEVIGHSITGSTYSIDHGSIGTFQPKLSKDDRDQWTYRKEREDNVWDYFYDHVVNKDYITSDGEIMKIMMTGVDTGYYTHYAYAFIDQFPGRVVGVKGRGEDRYLKRSADVPTFKLARERNNLYILEVDQIKDDVSERIGLRWNQKLDDLQPHGFMNFPAPSDGKYNQKYFFVQYEAEQRKLEMNSENDVIGWKWVKISESMQNHFFDCFVYNVAVRDIVSKMICKESGINNGKWNDFVDIVKKML